ncbi:MULTISPECIES: trehalose operon repressor [Metabacillus]|jgi:GntR family trehalose operon transcriptional repressor|uniref:Trehalose operon repressor n=1 Tax=Metabacillus rhizolycopersici TaxID=2875709 RepID=A0ABS7UNW2_9BACI|nr:MULTISPECIES: trehalose operon repressor [Metabacillus]MBZ5749977.1 trehalose operon repressor [Metabacillus rhizolycopersici]MCM3654564.1 trehalose operon repressor [Metabacillus litoralis]
MRNNKYLSIYKDWTEKIKSGEIKAGEALPSENDLAEAYDTSRETIRKALNLLSQNGFIQKIRGKGSIVIDVQKMSFPISGLVSFKEISKNFNMEPITTVHDFGLVKPDPFMKQQLNASSKDEIWKVIRSRTIGGEHIILDKDYFLKKYVPTLTKQICESSIYEYLEKELQLNISFAKKEIVVEDCTEEDRGYLDLEGFSHIVVVKNYVYLDNASLFQYTESRHRLDKFRFVDFARRGV